MLLRNCIKGEACPNGLSVEPVILGLPSGMGSNLARAFLEPLGFVLISDTFLFPEKHIKLANISWKHLRVVTTEEERLRQVKAGVRTSSLNLNYRRYSFILNIVIF